MPDKLPGRRTACENVRLRIVKDEPMPELVSAIRITGKVAGQVKNEFL